MYNKTLRELARTDNVSDLPLFRALGDIPTVQRPPDLVRIVRRRQEQRRMSGSYEEANWDRLSPLYREAHNKLRAARGLPPIPPPEVDRYMPPPPGGVRKFDPNDNEVVAAFRQAEPRLMGPRGGEGEVIPERFRKIFGR